LVFLGLSHYVVICGFPFEKSWIVSPAVPVEVATITPKAVATVLSKDIVDVLEKLALEVVVAEVYSQCVGTVVCHPYNLEKEESRRIKITARVRHCYLRIRLLPLIMF
jgi:hypothetical protein